VKQQHLGGRSWTTMILRKCEEESGDKGSESFLFFLFYFILFYFILFYFILFYFILFSEFGINFLLFPDLTQ